MGYWQATNQAAPLLLRLNHQGIEMHPSEQVFPQK
jgi:hypothetical protein